MFEYPVFTILLEPWVERENANFTIEVQNKYIQPVGVAKREW